MNGELGQLFPGIDLASFWDDDDYYREQYTDDPLTADKIAETEKALGYKLPAAYVALMRNRNGGAPRNTSHRVSTPTSWAPDHVAMTGFLSIGSSSTYSLCGQFGSEFMIEEWQYPRIGIYFADCPSGGHDMLCLDYRECGPSGEPRVVHVDQGRDFAITRVADDFTAFVNGLEPSEAFDEPGDLE